MSSGVCDYRGCSRPSEVLDDCDHRSHPHDADCRWGLCDEHWVTARPVVAPRQVAA